MKYLFPSAIAENESYAFPFGKRSHINTIIPYAASVPSGTGSSNATIVPEGLLSLTLT
jgi:hypothetical protein